MLQAESHLFGSIGRSFRDRLGIRAALTRVNTVVDGRNMRALVVRSSLVAAYAAALGATAWATFLELDRSPRRDLPLAAEPTAAQPMVPESEWRAWARHQVGLQKRVAALMTAQPTRLASAAPIPAPAPRPAIAARTSWSSPEPVLKPVQWNGDGKLLLAVNLAEEPTERSSSGSAWSRFLTLVEPASASTMAGADSERGRSDSAAERSGGGQSVAQHGSTQADSRAGGDAVGDSGPPGERDHGSDRSSGDGRSTGHDRNTGTGRNSDGDRNSGNDRSMGSDRSDRGDRGPAGDRSAGGDRGRDRNDRDDRGHRGERDDRSDRDRGDRGGRGDRGDGGRGRD